MILKTPVQNLDIADKRIGNMLKNTELSDKQKEVVQRYIYLFVEQSRMNTKTSMKYKFQDVVRA